MKKLGLLFAMLCVCAATVFAQGGLRIVTGHPDFKIKIKRCEASGSTCIVDMVMMNAGSGDISAYVYGGWNPETTIVYDDEGNSYSGGKIKVQTGSAAPSDLGVSVNLPSEVPVKVRLYIEGIVEEAAELSRIDLQVNCTAWNIGLNKKVKISNVPISREGDF